MKFFLALLVWFVLVFIIGTGIVMAVTGKHLIFRGDLLVASVLGYVAAFAKYGCLTH